MAYKKNHRNDSLDMQFYREKGRPEILPEPPFWLRLTENKLRRYLGDHEEEIRQAFRSIA